MYNLSADEISMVDGGGDGNSSGYPASPRAVKQQSGSQGNWGRRILCGMAVSAAGSGIGNAVKGIGAGAGIGASTGFGAGVCGV